MNFHLNTAIAVFESPIYVWLFETPWTGAWPGFPVPHHHSEFAQVHIRGVRDAVQPSHPLLPSSASASVFPSIRVFSNELALHTKWPKYWASASASVLPTSIHNWFPLGLTGLIFLLYKRHSRVFSNTTVRMYQLFGTLPSLWSNSHSCMWLLERP